MRKYLQRTLHLEYQARLGAQLERPGSHGEHSGSEAGLRALLTLGDTSGGRRWGGIRFGLGLALAALGFLPWGGALRAATPQAQVDRSSRIIERFMTMPETGIPRRVLNRARGVAIISMLKGGFVWSGRVGDGVVLARTRTGWSGPCFIRAGGAGFGAQVGGKVTDYVLILNTPGAVRAFERGGTVELGGQLSAVAGPTGRTAETGVLPVAAVYTYSRSRGLFAGASLEGTVIMTNRTANNRYYHRPVTARAILNSEVRAPRGASRLRAVL